MFRKCVQVFSSDCVPMPYSVSVCV
jgi:hypothetical protein